METNKVGYGGLGFGVALAVVSLSACANQSLSEGSQTAALVEADSSSNRDGHERGPVAAGRRAFQEVLPGVVNERACATCHVEAQAMTLSPAELATRAPDDPLFNAIDADDPSASPLTFNNLRAGLVRITLQLPENVDLLAIPPDASMFTPPAVSAQILAQWRASIVPGARLGDPLPPDRDLGNGVVIHYQPEIISHTCRSQDLGLARSAQCARHPLHRSVPRRWPRANARRAGVLRARGPRPAGRLALLHERLEAAALEVGRLPVELVLGRRARSVRGAADREARPLRG